MGEILEQRVLLTGPSEAPQFVDDVSAIPDQTVQFAQDQPPLTVAMPSEAADGSPVSYSAQLDTTLKLEEAAYRLDGRFNLVFTGDYLENWGGAGEKWIQNSVTQAWYFILPNGDFHWYTGAGPGPGMVPGSPLVGTLDSSHHADPTKLHTAPVPDSPPRPLASILDERLKLVSTTAHPENWGGAGEKWVRTVNNGPLYFILPNGDFHHWTGAQPGSGFVSGSPRIATLDASFHADPSELYEAPLAAESITDLAYLLDTTYNLNFTGNYSEDWGGAGEKWIQNSVTQAWYFILPNGDFHWYTGAGPEPGMVPGSPYLATLDPSYHADPTKLHTAPQSVLGAALAATTVGIEDNVLTVTPGGGALGLWPVDVTAVDGTTQTSHTFGADILTKTAVTLALEDQLIAQGATSVTVPLPATDANGVALSYSTQIVEVIAGEGPQGEATWEVLPTTSTAVISGTDLIVTPEPGFFGQLGVTLSADNGSETLVDAFVVSLAGPPPDSAATRVISMATGGPTRSHSSRRRERGT